MPLIQIDLTEDQDKKLEIYKIENKLESKAEAIKQILDKIEIELNLGEKKYLLHEGKSSKK